MSIQTALARLPSRLVVAFSYLSVMAAILRGEPSGSRRNIDQDGNATKHEFSRILLLLYPWRKYVITLSFCRWLLVPVCDGGCSTRTNRPGRQLTARLLGYQVSSQRKDLALRRCHFLSFLSKCFCAAVPMNRGAEVPLEPVFSELGLGYSNENNSMSKLLIANY